MQQKVSSPIGAMVLCTCFAAAGTYSVRILYGGLPPYSQQCFLNSSEASINTETRYSHAPSFEIRIAACGSNPLIKQCTITYFSAVPVNSPTKISSIHCMMSIERVVPCMKLWQTPRSFRRCVGIAVTFSCYLECLRCKKTLSYSRASAEGYSLSSLITVRRVITFFLTFLRDFPIHFGTCPSHMMLLLGLGDFCISHRIEVARYR